MAFDTPMVTIELEHLFSVGAHRRVAGQAVSNIVGFFAKAGRGLQPVRQAKLVISCKVKVLAWNSKE